MDYLCLFAVIILLCIILNISALKIITGVLILLGLMVLGMMLIFLYYFLRLLGSKRRKATFQKIDRSDRLPFQTAYYQIDGTNYPCVFPAEGILQHKLYKKEKVYHVLYHPQMKQVYDRYALLSCILGTFLSINAIGVIYLLVKEFFLSL